MLFDTKVAGIPCQCEVTHFIPYVPARLDGHPDTWMPPEGGEFEFRIRDRRGHLAPWLEAKLTPADEERLWEEFLIARKEEEYDCA